MRIHVFVNDRLLAEAMAAIGLTAKREVSNLAGRRSVSLAGQEEFLKNTLHTQPT